MDEEMDRRGAFIFLVDKKVKKLSHYISATKTVAKGLAKSSFLREGKKSPYNGSS
jgi:hypothetical protein